MWPGTRGATSDYARGGTAGGPDQGYGRGGVADPGPGGYNRTGGGSGDQGYGRGRQSRRKIKKPVVTEDLYLMATAF